MSEETITGAEPEQTVDYKAEYEKEKEKYENIKKAMLEERGKRKEKDEALKSKEEDYERLQKAEQKSIEDDKKRKGKYEELLAEKTSLIEELQSKATKYDELISKQNESEKNKLSAIETEIPDEVKEKYAWVLSKLDNSWKIEFYEGIKETIKKPDFDWWAGDNKTPPEQSEWVEWDMVNLINQLG